MALECGRGSSDRESIVDISWSRCLPAPPEKRRRGLAPRSISPPPEWTLDEKYFLTISALTLQSPRQRKCHGTVALRVILTTFKCPDIVPSAVSDPWRGMLSCAF